MTADSSHRRRQALASRRNLKKGGQSGAAQTATRSMTDVCRLTQIETFDLLTLKHMGTAAFLSLLCHALLSARL